MMKNEFVIDSNPQPDDHVKGRWTKHNTAVFVAPDTTIALTEAVKALTNAVEQLNGYIHQANMVDDEYIHGSHAKFPQEGTGE